MTHAPAPRRWVGWLVTLVLAWALASSPHASAQGWRALARLFDGMADARMALRETVVANELRLAGEGTLALRQLRLVPRPPPVESEILERLAGTTKHKIFAQPSSGGLAEARASFLRASAGDFQGLSRQSADRIAQRLFTRSDQWLEAVAKSQAAASPTEARGVAYFTAIDGRLLVSRGGSGLAPYSSASRSSFTLGHYDIDPRAVLTESWQELAPQLREAGATITLRWLEGGAVRTARTSWLPGDRAVLLFEPRPNLHAPVESRVGRHLFFDADASWSRMAEREPFRIADLRWLNLQTAGDVSVIERAVGTNRTLRLRLSDDGATANLKRFRDALRDVKGKVVLLTGHVEADHFVSRVAGREQFRIAIADAFAMLEEAGAHVVPIGCELAATASVGPLHSVLPKQIAQAILAARKATTRLDFLAALAKDVPMVMADVHPRLVEAAGLEVTRGRVLAVPLGLLAGGSTLSDGASAPAPSATAKLRPLSTTPAGLQPLQRPVRPNIAKPITQPPSSVPPSSNRFGCSTAGASHRSSATPTVVMFGAIALHRLRRRRTHARNVAA